MSSLLVTSGVDSGRRYTLGERTRIGRAPDNQIVLIDNLVSRYHAEVVREGIHFHVRDLGSKNGILVNNTAATDHRLRFGDQVRIGETAFSFESAKEFKTARFSDVVVSLAQSGDKDVRIFDDPGLPPLGDDPAAQLVEQSGRLLECQADELPDILMEMLQGILNQFGAQVGALLLRARSGEAMPLVAVAEDDRLSINGAGAGVVLNEAKSVLSARMGRPDEPPCADMAMIVPLSRQGRVFGALHLERIKGEPFSTADLALLRAIARLASGAVRMAIQMDQMALASPSGKGEPYIGVSPQADSVRERIRRVAASESTVLLTGETGAGKELVARSIHDSSARAGRPYVVIDCSTIPANLMESELFGHEAGAFTGADRLKRGKVEMAEGGTLLLDEIGELNIDLQPKLLRFLEELYFYRVGGMRPIQADVRIIAATNRNLVFAASEGRFRQDLLYRLNVMPIHLPPLRQRPEDVRALTDYYAPRLASRLGKPFLGLVDDAWTLLEQYPWPGNVRELHHALERALILSDDGILRPEHFQLAMPEGAPSDSTTDGASRGLITPKSRAERTDHISLPSLDQVEAQAIRRAMRYANGNRVMAAKILCIHRNTLTRKLNQHKIDVD